MKSYEECLIFDRNWYTYQELEEMYPADEVFCIVKKGTTVTLYQPKVVTTSNLDAYLLAMDDYGHISTNSSGKYSSGLFTGPVLSDTGTPSLVEVIITKRDNYY